MSTTTPIVTTIWVDSAASSAFGMILYTHGNGAIFVPPSALVTIGGQSAERDDVPRWVSGRAPGTVIARISRSLDDGTILAVDLGVQQ